MKKIIYIFLLFFGFNFFSIYPVIFVIHGAFARNAKWYRPGGTFFEALKKEAQKIGENIIPFSWEQPTGGITMEERILGGFNLAKAIIAQIRKGEKKVMIISHSYGGHVACWASYFLGRREVLPKIGESYSMNDFYREYNIDTLKEKCASDLPYRIPVNEGLQKILNEYGEKRKEVFNVDNFRKLRMSLRVYENNLYGLNKNYEEIVDRYEKELNFVNSHYRIAELYMLGTPHDANFIVPDMDVVGSVYNLYSEGDITQGLMGKRIVTLEIDSKRLVNINVIGTGGNCSFCLPNHITIHSANVGKWLLFLGDVFQRIGIVFKEKGVIAFSHHPTVLMGEDKISVYLDPSSYWGITFASIVVDKPKI